MRGKSWGLVLLAGLAVLAALPARATQPARARRTEQVTAPAAVHALALAVENGDVRVIAGPAFAATVELEVRAETQAAADFLLARSKLRSSFEEHAGHKQGKVVLAVAKPNQDEIAGNGRHTLLARFQITLPASAAAMVTASNGDVGIHGVRGDIEVHSTNGDVEVRGAGRSLRLHSTNGKVEATLAEVLADAQISAETTNGPVTLWVPPNARLRLEAGTTNGDVVSTLGLPVQVAPPGYGPLNPRYQGGSGGPIVRLKSTNGRIAVYATGSNPARAQALVVRGQQLQRASARAESGDEVVRGKVDGDLVVEGGTADVRADLVTGGARVRTRAGDVHIGTVAGAAQLETQGGDVKVARVRGDLQARTGGGDLEAGEVGGQAKLEAQGGNITLAGAGGDVTAVTGGGNIRLLRVRGGVRAMSAGGDIEIELVSKEVANGIDVGSTGGDVTLVLPANFRADVHLEAGRDHSQGADASKRIVSEWKEIVPVAEAGGVYSARAKLGGGGPRLVVRTKGGIVTIKKAPAI